ncbi:ABC transporter permease [Micromonospora yangpuensis]|uniref:ABC transporter permease n=1 Tax=Micromonospora yangpuensis TaxID=683228 RepID=UPI000B848197|nr:ABC transporter permease [Micromonospora yangpuensis]
MSSDLRAAPAHPPPEPSPAGPLAVGPAGTASRWAGTASRSAGVGSRWAGAASAWAGGRTVLTLLRRDLSEHRGLGPPFLLDLAFGLVNLLVFRFVSQVVTLGPDADFTRSTSYFDFVAVGIVFLLVLQAGTVQVVTRLAGEQRAGTLELLTAQPVPRWALGLGLAGYPFVFALLRAGLYLAVLGTFFGLHIGRADWVGVVVVAALGALCTLPFGLALAGLAVAFGAGEPVARLLVVALSFLSGTYFPVSALPVAVRAFAEPLPTRIALDGLRHALTGGGWSTAALALTGAAAVLLPLSAWIFDRALWLARRRGVLTRD